MYSKLFLFVFGCSSIASGYKTGAPIPACSSMSPSHEGKAPQPNDTLPYKVILSTTKVEQNDTVAITLSPKIGKTPPIPGFFIQVRKVDSKVAMAFGEFDDFIGSEDARPVKCFNVPINNAMTQTSNQPKENVTVVWVASTGVGKYRVHVTYVKDYNTFWVNQIHEQVIEVAPESARPKIAPPKTDLIKDTKVAPESQTPGVSSAAPKDVKSSEEPPLETLCSTQNLNPGVEPVDTEPNSDSPWEITLQNHGSVEEGNTLWINITSEHGTPIMKLFIQVRRSGTDSNSYGTFKTLTSSKLIEYRPVNCFDGKDNALIVTNHAHDKGPKISDLSILWQAPENGVGSYLVMASLLKEPEDVFIDIGHDKESHKISVVAKADRNDKGEVIPPSALDEGKDPSPHPTSSGSQTLFTAWLIIGAFLMSHLLL